MKIMVKATNLTFAYQDKPERIVIDNVSFELEPESINVILGLSGSGKTTLSQILSGIIPNCIGGVLEGRIFFDGLDVTTQPLSQRAGNIGYVMQDPDRQMIATTVEDEVAFAMENLCMDPVEIRLNVDRILSLLGIGHLRFNNPGQLSGGEKQIVAIAGILALDPQVVILDEPLSHLDEGGRQRVSSVLRELKSQGKTLIIVEQDYELLDFADRWIVLDRGIIKREGTPAQLLALEDLF